MDMGASLVQAYLRVHGYFTVSEYPILETKRHGDHRVATEIDILRRPEVPATVLACARVGASPCGLQGPVFSFLMMLEKPHTETGGSVLATAAR